MVTVPKEKAIGVPAKMMRKASGPKKMLRLIAPMASQVAWKAQSRNAIKAVTAIPPISWIGRTRRKRMTLITNMRKNAIGIAVTRQESGISNAGLVTIPWFIVYFAE